MVLFSISSLMYVDEPRAQANQQQEWNELEEQPLHNLLLNKGKATRRKTNKDDMVDECGCCT